MLLTVLWNKKKKKKMCLPSSLLDKISCLLSWQKICCAYIKASAYLMQMQHLCKLTYSLQCLVLVAHSSVPVLQVALLSFWQLMKIQEEYWAVTPILQWISLGVPHWYILVYHRVSKNPTRWLFSPQLHLTTCLWTPVERRLCVKQGFYILM